MEHIKLEEEVVNVVGLMKIETMVILRESDVDVFADGSQECHVLLGL